MMFVSGVEAVHLEPTARCNAGCPMCARTGNELILGNQGEISYDEFIIYFPEDFVKGLKQFKFCGNYGDPAVANDLLKMHQYLYDINPDIRFIMSTNGGVRPTRYWKELGELYAKSPQSRMHFHIDGLEDTNHIYRVGVKWEKVIANAHAFISAGGKADWFFIPFFHNEHQVEEAEQIAYDMGFDEFVIKVSARFSDFRKPFSNGSVKIYPPTDNRFNIEGMQVEGPLICFAEKRKEIYVDAWGRLFPCCWTASRFNNTEGWVQHKDPTINSLRHRSIEEIHADPKIDEWINSLYCNKASVCNKRCTGSYQHVIDIKGQQRPQKELWYSGEQND